VAYAIWDGCLAAPLGMTEAVINLSDSETGADDGGVTEPADADWTPLNRARWVAVALQVLTGAMDAYEADTGDLRPRPPQDLAETLAADDDGQGVEADDPRERWAGILPAEAINQPEASVPGLS